MLPSLQMHLQHVEESINFQWFCQVLACTCAL